MGNKKQRGLLKYELKEPIWTREAQACRYALASTRRKLDSTDAPPDAEDLQAMEQFAEAPPLGSPRRRAARSNILLHVSRILGDYRQQLQRLRDEGWSPLQGQLGWYRAMNCPPIGVSTVAGHNWTPCRQRSVCPWCWCYQYVRETYLNVEYAVYGTNSKTTFNPRAERQEKPLIRGTWNLAVFVRDYGYYEVDDMPKMWADIIATRPITPKFLSRRGQVAGMFYLYAIYPTDPRFGTATFHVQKRVLALVEQDFEWDEGEVFLETDAAGNYPGELECVKRCDRLSRREIVGAVGMVGAYPRQLLYGPARLLYLLLEQKRRQYIPPGRRQQCWEEAVRAEQQKPLAEQDPTVICGGPTAYKRYTGIRLSAHVGLFRNRGKRLQHSQRFVEEGDAKS